LGYTRAVPAIVPCPILPPARQSSWSDPSRGYLGWYGSGRAGSVAAARVQSALRPGICALEFCSRPETAVRHSPPASVYSLGILLRRMVGPSGVDGRRRLLG